MAEIVRVGFFSVPKKYNGKNLALRLHDELGKYLKNKNEQFKYMVTSVTNPFILKNFIKSGYEIKDTLSFEDFTFENQKVLKNCKNEGYVDNKPCFYLV